MDKQSNLEQDARNAGFPAALFGFSPQDAAYWREPGLPWVTPRLLYNPPPARLGGALMWHYAELRGTSMGPRFPAGCVVNVAPVYERANLVVGRVYLYRYTDGQTGAERWDIGRLEKIGGNCLWARADNEPNGASLGACWLLREKEAEAVWDVYEVTHYVSYPEL